jgi:hypothetical protein
LNPILLQVQRKKSLKIPKGGNQIPYIEEEQTTQWPSEKVQKDKQQSTKHTHKTKDGVNSHALYIYLQVDVRTDVTHVVPVDVDQQYSSDIYDDSDYPGRNDANQGSRVRTFRLK